ncbi:MAG: hypothetical protein ABH844_06855, partial [Candidatus Omnitrophota bacterium]
MKKLMVLALSVFISCILFNAADAHAGASISISGGGTWPLGSKGAQSETASPANQWTVTNDADGTEDVLIKVTEGTSAWTARTTDDPGVNANTTVNEFVLRENSSTGALITGTDTTLKTGLAMGGTYSFGLWFKTPPVGSSEGEKTLTVTLTATNWVYACDENITFTYKGASVTYGIVPSQGRCWLDRNLGASRVAIAYDDASAYGDLFQWGRLDDGHQTQTSGVTSTNSGGDVPGHASFITEPVYPFDWRVPQNNALWQGVSGTNNPCPSGWRVPTEAEWRAVGVSNIATAFASPL